MFVINKNLYKCANADLYLYNYLYKYKNQIHFYIDIRCAYTHCWLDIIHLYICALILYHFIGGYFGYFVVQSCAIIKNFR